MNKKAVGETLWHNVIYLFFLIVFFSSVLYFVFDKMNGASLWADYYAKEISKTINFAKPGDVITLDVHKATEIAKKNKLESFSEIFIFDNVNNNICVKLSSRVESCYSYFNKVDVVNPEIKLGLGDNKNTLNFKISEKLKEKENE